MPVVRETEEVMVQIAPLMDHLSNCEFLQVAQRIVSRMGGDADFAASGAAKSLVSA